MSKFKKGDRVRVVDAEGFKLPIISSHGKVYSTDALGAYFRVKDEAGNQCKYYMFDWRLELEEQYPTIVITTDGVVTKAVKRLGKEVLGTAYSKCAPADIFDADTGAAIALARLIGANIKFHDDEPEQIETKFRVVCTASTNVLSSHYYTVGKIYDAKHIDYKDGHYAPVTKISSNEEGTYGEMYAIPTTVDGRYRVILHGGDDYAEFVRIKGEV